MKTIFKELFAITIIFIGFILIIGSVGTMDLNAELGKTNNATTDILAIAGTIIFAFGAYYAHVLAVRLAKWGKC